MDGTQSDLTPEQKARIEAEVKQRLAGGDKALKIANWSLVGVLTATFLVGVYRSVTGRRTEATTTM